MIEAAKRKESLNAIFLFLFLIKNETVIGIIGNTQGVNNAANPLISAKMNKPQELSLVSALCTPLKVFVWQTPCPFSFL